MFKKSGHPCPSCNALPCAEHAQKDQPVRWTCNHCGASGEIAGQTADKPQAAAPQPKPHWRDKR